MKRLLLVTSVLALVGWALPAGASAALTATQIRIGDHPAFVRVVVDFTGGTLHSNQVEAPDALPFDGGARVRITAPGITTHATRKDVDGVVARVAQGTGSIVLWLSSSPHRFKYLAHTVLHSPERLAVDLWKARPPSPAAEFPVAPQGACLTIDHFSESPGRIGASGTEQNLFEHMFQADVRNHRGDVKKVRSVTATNGHWSTTLGFDVTRTQAGTLEAVDFSEQDGSLTCIAQVRVTLEPAP
jgi:hypothetical protein